MSVFGIQAAFSGAGLVFAFYMLSAGASASIYLPMATGIIAAWLPSPRRVLAERQGPLACEEV